MGGIMTESTSLEKPIETASGPGTARSIAAGEFKAKCLKLLDEVADTREPIVITKFGKPVAKLVPIEAERTQLRGALRGTVLWEGDIISPLGEDAWGWFAEP
jgi:prevent-host-death family protein